MPPADLELVVQEAAQPWVPLFVPRVIVTATVRYLLSGKQTRGKHDVCRQRQNLQVLLHGVQPDAMSGRPKAAVTIQSAEKEVTVTEELVGGLTTSQVSS